MTTATRYELSFTTGGLLAREGGVLAPIYVEVRDWREVRDRAVAENLLQARTRSSNVRLVRETVKRLSALTDPELEVLTELTATERGHLMWTAACRRYAVIGEFAEDVLRERFLTLAGTLTYADYDSFFRSKALWHDELNDVTDTSFKKLRQVLFRMLGDAGFVGTQGQIEPALISTRVTDYLNHRTPSDIRFFPTRAV